MRPQTQPQDELKALLALGIPLAGPILGAVAGGFLTRLLLGPQIAYLGAIAGAVAGNQLESERRLPPH